MPRALVLGAGFAGLAAAVELAARGIQVTVCEARRHLGGRARSFEDPATGAVVDNGQHAMLGCYHETLAFLARVGADGDLVRQASLRIDFVDPVHGRGTLACPPWPSPLHTLGGLLGYRLLSRQDRLRALYAGVRLLHYRRQRQTWLARVTVADLLQQLGQSAPARRCFWDPLVLATLNEEPGRAAAAPLAEVLARAFFASRRDAAFVLSRVGLSELYADRAQRFIEARGGSVLTGAKATGLIVRDGRCAGVVLRDGRRIEAAGCISALPPRALLALLPPVLQPPGLERFLPSPIVSVHLWLDRPVLPAAFLGLLGTTTHWVFSRSRLAADASPRVERAATSARPSGGELVSAVISAGRTQLAWDSRTVVERTVADLRAAVPAARDAMLERSIVVKEREATTAPTVEVERLRPPAETALEGLWLAGDWTATGLPPTIESAVVSGRHAAARLAARAAVC